MKMTLSIFWVLAGAGLFAQMYEPSPMEAQNRNPTLEQLAVGEIVGDLSSDGAGDYAYWATSFLPAEGKPPVPPSTEGLSEDDAAWTLMEFEALYDQWSAMYSPEKLTDGDPATAWSEGALGPGIGEVVLARIDTTQPVSLWTGFGKSQRDFTNNGRPKSVRVWVLQAQRMDVAQRGAFYLSVTALASRVVELKDLNGWQELPLPAHRLSPLTDSHGLPETLSSFVALEILSVYPGARYQDTLISEIANR